MLGIFLLSRRLLPMLIQVTAFTVAQSINLALTLNGTIAAPSSGVEPMLALFVVYVAFENLVTSDLKPWRLALVFGSGSFTGWECGRAARAGAAAWRAPDWMGRVQCRIEAGQLGVIVLAFLIVGSWVRRHEGIAGSSCSRSAAIALTGSSGRCSVSCSAELTMTMQFRRDNVKRGDREERRVETR